MEVKRWHREHYLARYPSPPRDSNPLTEDEAREHGFRFIKRQGYTNEVSFSVKELADYLMTQSNVMAAVEEDAEDREDVRGWLLDSLAPLFPVLRGTFRFGGTIEYLQKIESGRA